MEPEHSPVDITQKSRFTEITSFSKYLTLVLFIVMPFVGGWVGYTYAPEKVRLVEQTVVREVPVERVASDTTANEIPVEQYSYDWCIHSGGLDRTPGFNAPKVCVLNNKVYKMSCVSNDKYFVVQGDTSGGYADILVKHKDTPEWTFPCEYSVDDNDFVIKSNGPDYLFALEGEHLLIDSGTGPAPRGMTIYDLSTNTKVFSDSYLGPVSIKDGRVKYWTTATVDATEENCPEFDTIKGYGLLPAIDEQVVLDLLTISKEKIGKSRCSERQ